MKLAMTEIFFAQLGVSREHEETSQFASSPHWALLSQQHVKTSMGCRHENSALQGIARMKSIVARTDRDMHRGGHRKDKGFLRHRESPGPSCCYPHSLS